MRRPRNRRRGQALVESTLCLLGVVLMILAIMDFGQVLMFLQFLTERSRAGARYAAVASYNPTAIKNYIVYNSPAQSSGPGLMGLQPSNVSVQRYDIGQATDRIEIKISNYPLRFYTPFLAGVYTPRPFRTVIPVESLGATN